MSFALTYSERLECGAKLPLAFNKKESVSVVLTGVSYAQCKYRVEFEIGFEQGVFSEEHPFFFRQSFFW